MGLCLVWNRGSLPRFLTVRDIQHQTKLSRSASYELMHAVGIVRFGRSLRVPADRLLAYLEEKCLSSTNEVTSFGRPVTRGLAPNASASSDQPASETTAARKPGAPPPE